VDKTGLSRRVIVGWSLAMLAVVGLAWLVGAVVWPLLKTRQALEEWTPPYATFTMSWSLPSGPPPKEGYWYEPRHPAGTGPVMTADYDPLSDPVLRRLGGRERIVERLDRYLRLPQFLTTKECRLRAICVLKLCGEEQGAQALINALGNPDWEIRARAALALSETWPPASETVLELEGLLDDKKDVVRWSAAWSLKKIRADQARKEQN